MQILTGLRRPPEGLAFSPDGRYLASGHDDVLHAWDLSGEPAPLWTARAGFAGQNFAFTPDGSAVVAGQAGYFARFDARSGRRDLTAARRPPCHPYLFSPDGRFALAHEGAEAEGVVRLVCVRYGRGRWAGAWRKDLPGNPNEYWLVYPTLLFSADGGRLARVLGPVRDGGGVSPVGVEVFDSATGGRVAEWAGKLPPVWGGDGAVGPTGTVVLLTGRSFHAVDTARPGSEPVKRTNATSRHFTAAEFSRDGTRLATTSNDTAATVWDAATWAVRRRYAWDVGRLRAVAFSPDGLRCAAAGDAGQVVVWDLDD